MQLISLATGISAALFARAVSAEQAVTEYNLNATGVGVSNTATIVNNCPYDVYLWSILKGHGCPSDGAVKLKAGGGLYHEEYRKEKGVSVLTGVSIKISKTDQCKGVDITQLEYYEERNKPDFPFNFLDVSYVDCLGGDCPARKDGYYLKAGNVNKVTTANADKAECPTFECTDQESCDKTSYVLPDDKQTKSCELDEPLEFYMCGKSPQGGNEEKPQPSPSSSSEEEVESSQTPTPSVVKENINAVITPAAKPIVSEPPKVWTEVVYVTQYQTINQKRHAHGHVHRHFRA